jgi:hypothetical protein
MFLCHLLDGNLVPPVAPRGFGVALREDMAVNERVETLAESRNRSASGSDC